MMVVTVVPSELGIDVGHFVELGILPLSLIWLLCLLS